jgi:ribosomal small subunit protein bTHX
MPFKQQTIQTGDTTMGRGDARTKKGKIFKKSTGNTRPAKKTKKTEQESTAKGR